jgi:hypothetical protein
MPSGLSGLSAGRLPASNHIVIEFVTRARNVAAGQNVI